MLLTLKVLLGVTTVVAVFALVTSSIERNAIERHEQTFNDQQHVQTRIAAQGFKQSLSDLDGTIRGALRAITPSRLVSSPRANAPELLSILRGSPLVAGMVLLPDDGAPLLLGEAEPGTRLSEAIVRWVEAHRLAAHDIPGGPYVAPLVVTPSDQRLGLLYPLSPHTGNPAVLAIIVNLEHLANLFIAPLRSGQYGAGFLVDGEGTVLYDHETDIIGQNIFEGMHKGFEDLLRVDKRITSEPSGTDAYTFPLMRGLEVSRKLVAWTQAHFANARFSVVLSAPEREIAHTLSDLHTQQALAWVVLLLLLLATGVLGMFRNVMHHEKTSRQRLADILEHLPDPTFVVDEKQRILAWNKALEDMTGASKAQMLGAPSTEISRIFFGDEKRPLLLDALNGAELPDVYDNITRDGDVIRCETFHPNLRGGEGAYLWITAARLPDTCGCPAGGIETLRDITTRKHYEERIKSSEERYALAVAGANDGIWDWDLTTDTVYFSPRWLEIIGLSPAEEPKAVTLWMDRIHPDDKQRVLACNHTVIHGTQNHFEVEYRLRHTDGSYRWILGRGAGLRAEDGSIRRVAGAHTDITERKHTENVNAVLFHISNAISTTRDLDHLFSSIHAALKAYIDADNLIIALVDEERDRLEFRYLHDEVETHLSALENISSASVRGMNMEVIRTGQPQLLHREQQMAVEVIGTPSEVWLGVPLMLDGKVIGVMSTQDYADPHKFSELDVELMVSVSEQVAMAIQRKQNEEELARLALHDPLTGLPNRNLFSERLERALQRTKRHAAYQFAVLLFDLDGFKKVNDSFGHHVGDELLTRVATRLKPALRNTDTMARLGGDEFAILLEDFNSTREVISIVKRIQGEVGRPYVTAQSTITISASIGIVLQGTQYTDTEAILRDADTAMYQAKGMGKATFMVFNKEMHEQTVQMLTMERDLHSGAANDEFELQYQPLFNTKDFTVSGVEALVRWRHPERGLLSPADFLGVAEDCGFVAQLDTMVIGKACADMARLVQSPHIPRDFTMHINISSLQLQNSGITTSIAACLRESGLAPERLTLEFSEHAAMSDPPAALETFRRLKRLGVSIALDDFGTGQSSLSYLQRFPIDTVKVDRRFTNTICTSTEDRRTVRSMTVLAESMGLDVIAEGVETQQQLDLLQEFKCDMVQGFLFGKPVAYDKVSSMLQSMEKLASPLAQTEHIA